MARTLKVYRTPIGFHDAYVAAPTQKAALEAWGTDRNLFARGDAEIVTDPKLTREPLSKPGTVFKKSRGNPRAQFAELERASAGKSSGSGKNRRQSEPDRRALDEAQAELANARTRYADEIRVLDQQISKLETERRQVLREHDRGIAKLERSVRRSKQNTVQHWRAGATTDDRFTQVRSRS